MPGIIEVSKSNVKEKYHKIILANIDWLRAIDNDNEKPSRTQSTIK